MKHNLRLSPFGKRTRDLLLLLLHWMSGNPPPHCTETIYGSSTDYMQSKNNPLDDIKWLKSCHKQEETFSCCLDP